MLDVRRLRLLLELDARGTLAAVAEALHQSPSSVSQQLSQLEREVGVELLRKVGRGVQLTPQAAILVGHAEAVVRRLEQAETDLAASLSEATGTVRLAMFQSAALALLPATLERLARDHPRLRVTVTQREPETALRETWTRDFDLVVAEQYAHHSTPHLPGLDRVDLVTDEVRLAVPADDTATASIRDVADRAWVMEPDDVASRHFAEQVCRSAGFEPDVRYETADLQAQVRLVETGHAVALLPGLLWSGVRPGVRLVDLPDAPRRTVFTAARASTVERPGIAACRAALAHAATSARQP